MKLKKQSLSKRYHCENIHSAIAWVEDEHEKPLFPSLIASGPCHRHLCVLHVEGVEVAWGRFREMPFFN